MRCPQLKQIPRAIALLLAISGAGLAYAGELDHREFDATLHVPFRADANATAEARTFTLKFEYPMVEQAQSVSWRVELLDPAGNVVQRWYGIESLSKDDVTVAVNWAGRSAALADGLYQVRLTASSSDAASVARPAGVVDEFVERNLAASDADVIEQSWDMQVGTPATPAMPAFRAMPSGSSSGAGAALKASAKPSAASLRAMPALTTGANVAATPGLPYTVYFSNLHSQTNHSDGGGNLASCGGAQNPQAGQYGPDVAFQYAQDHGLDILMTSEHNHMYDGSDNTNTAATPAFAKNLYQSGLAIASAYNAAHPNFLAVYGMEWGVINNGGHMNIFNSNELFGWEYNASNQLLADTFTAKGDYAGLYTLMAQRGLVGQFNHPSSSGQFLVNGTALGYTADGDTAMALCEVANTSAFSINTTETETSRSSYEGACKKALEAGYHIAFSTDQDNHCANWGASYTNRTGVMIPTGTPLTNASFVDAIKARRVFATFDKNSQLVLTANSHLMGETFTNAGPLTLTANFSNSAGRSATTVQIYEGVPKRNGTITLMSSNAVNNITPAVGAHFYYAKVTQDDGKTLWSAPVWVNQIVDTLAPTVSVGVIGSSGNIVLNASASDNVGVARVDFYVDDVLKGSASVSPYALTLDSTALNNGTHVLSAKAVDAANNVGVASNVSFAVNNTPVDTVAPTVSAAVSGNHGPITLSASASDNVGVTLVEFYVDSALKGSTNNSPYTLAFDTTQVGNGTHALNAKAYDAAHNVGSSGDVSFNVNNAVDVSAQVRVSASGLTFNRATQLFSGTVTLSNQGGTSLNGPLQLELDGLAAGISLANASGMHNGAPYLSVGAASLAAGASVSVPVSFANPAKANLSYTAKTYSGPF